MATTVSSGGTTLASQMATFIQQAQSVSASSQERAYDIGEAGLKGLFEQYAAANPNLPPAATAAVENDFTLLNADLTGNTGNSFSTDLDQLSKDITAAGLSLNVFDPDASSTISEAATVSTALSSISAAIADWNTKSFTDSSVPADAQTMVSAASTLLSSDTNLTASQKTTLSTDLAVAQSAASVFSATAPSSSTYSAAYDNFLNAWMPAKMDMLQDGIPVINDQMNRGTQAGGAASSSTPLNGAASDNVTYSAGSTGYLGFDPSNNSVGYWNADGTNGSPNAPDLKTGDYVVAEGMAYKFDGKQLVGAALPNPLPTDVNIYTLQSNNIWYDQGGNKA